MKAPKATYKPRGHTMQFLRFQENYINVHEYSIFLSLGQTSEFSQFVDPNKNKIQIHQLYISYPSRF